MKVVLILGKFIKLFQVIKSIKVFSRFDTNTCIVISFTMVAIYNIIQVFKLSNSCMSLIRCINSNSYASFIDIYIQNVIITAIVVSNIR